MPFDHVAAVTGANKGIGLAIVRQLALQYPKSPLNHSGKESFLIYLTGRDAKRTNDALETLQSDPQLKHAQALKQHGGLTELRVATVDIAAQQSITDFTTALKKEHGEQGIDVVVNNAGVAFNGFDGDVVRRTMAINYYGTLNATRAFLPLLKPAGRIVNLGSAAGRLGPRYKSEIEQRFYDAAKQGNVKGITELMEEFQREVEDKRWIEAGWPGTAYGVSKAGMIGMTIAIANEQRSAGSEQLINACCPGYVNTDMTKGRGVKTVDEGAQTPTMLAIGDIGGVSGDMWQDEKHYDW